MSGKKTQEIKKEKEKKQRQERIEKKKNKNQTQAFLSSHILDLKNKNKNHISSFKFSPYFKDKLFNDTRKKLPSPTIYFLSTPPDQTHQ